MRTLLLIAGLYMSAGVFLLSGIEYALSATASTIAILMAGVLGILLIPALLEIAGRHSEGNVLLEEFRASLGSPGYVLGAVFLILLSLSLAALSVSGIVQYLDSILSLDGAEWAVAVPVALLLILSGRGTGKGGYLLLLPLATVAIAGLAVFLFVVSGDHPWLPEHLFDPVVLAQASDGFYVAMIPVSLGVSTLIFGAKSNRLKKKAGVITAALVLIGGLILIWSETEFAGYAPLRFGNNLAPVFILLPSGVPAWEFGITVVAAISGLLALAFVSFRVGRDSALLIQDSSSEASDSHAARFLYGPRSVTLLSALFVLIAALFLRPAFLVTLVAGCILITAILVTVSLFTMRESHLDVESTAYRSPAYPWLPSIVLIVLLGFLISMQTSVLLVYAALTVGVILFYRRSSDSNRRVGGAIYYWLARLGEQQYGGLDRELRGILKEKGLRSDDPFEEVVARSSVLEAEPGESFSDVAARVARELAGVLPREEDAIAASFLEGTRLGMTPVTHGVALPHFRIHGLVRPALVLVRAARGLSVVSRDPFDGTEESHVVEALFFLVSDDENPGLHLRMLAQIADRVDNPGFLEEWKAAADDQELREVLLRDDRFLSLKLGDEEPFADWIGKTLAELMVPEGCLIALIRRGGSILVPHGDTVFRAGDRLTIIGESAAIDRMRQRQAHNKRET